MDPVTDASSFSYRPSFDGGLGRCTGAVSCGRQHLCFQGGGRHARVPRVCACACSSWPGRAGRPSRRVLVRLTFPLAVLSFSLLGSLGLELPVLGFFFVFFFPPFFPLPCRAPALSGFLCFLAMGALGLGALRFLLPPPPPPHVSLSSCVSCPLAPFVLALAGCGVMLFPALGAPGLGVARFPPPPPPRPPPFFTFLPCPPRPVCVFLSFYSFFFLLLFLRPLVSAFPLFPALGALGPGSLWLPAPPPPPLSLFVFFCGVPAFCRFPPLLVLLASALPGWVFSSSCVCGLACGVSAVCWGCAPTPPPSGGCSRLAVSRVFLCGAAACCGLVCVVRGALRCFPVPCGAGVVLCGVLSCCVVGFVAGCLPWGLVPSFLLVSCGALLWRAVLCSALSCVVPSRVVVWCVVPCVVLVCSVVWLLGPLRCVGFSCPAPPPCCCPLVPLPGPLFQPDVEFCPGVRCCVVLFCRLWCGVLLSASFLARGALLLRLRWLGPRVVACGCWVFVTWSVCPPLFSAGVLCRLSSCLAAWLAALLCAVVCCGARLLYAVTCVLWCCVAKWCRAVVPSCSLSFAGCVRVRVRVRVTVSLPSVCGAVWHCASCYSVPIWSVLLLVPRAVVCRCVWCCLPWRSVMWRCCPVAWRGVLWCRAVPCCVLWCCVALWCRAAGLCCVFSLAAGVLFSFPWHV